MKTFAFLVAACLALSALAADDSLNFMVIGDWGGQINVPYTTPGEVQCAAAMGTLGEKIDSQFVLALGDNFYDLGVRTVDDPRFKETFESVFTAPILQRPWYVCLGNHDHYGNATAQVEYSQVSSRWNLPSFYYTFTKTIPGDSNMTIQFVMIDTVELCGNTDDAMTAQPPGAKHPELAEAQWEWIEKTLEASTADYIIVGGHYPVYSVAEHGPTWDLVSRLKPLLDKANALYMNGHDHNLQYIDEGKGPGYYTIGATHDCDGSLAHLDDVPKESLKFHWSSGAGGFAAVKVTETSLSVAFLDSDGKTLWNAPEKKPRKLHGEERVKVVRSNE